MKYCPICDARYDEEIIKFCTKDGAPLIDEDGPKFTALPSENVDEPDVDFGEETIIRRKPDAGASPQSPDLSERIVIPTSQPEQQVRPRTSQAYYPPPPPPANTGKTIVLTILGTLVVLGFGAALFRLLQKDEPFTNVNTNINANLGNQNANLNTNLGFDSNYNFNTNANYSSNYNFNTSVNANVRPTPTPRPSPVPSPPVVKSPTPAPTPTPRPAANATPRTGPRPPLAANRPPSNEN